MDEIERYVHPILHEWPQNRLYDRYSDMSDPDLRRRVGGNELLTDVLVDLLGDMDYSSFVAQFGPASVGGPSPELTQLQLLQHTRRTVRSSTVPSLLADQNASRDRLFALYRASAQSLALLRVLNQPATLRELRDLFAYVAPASWLGAYGAAALSEDSLTGPPKVIPDRITG